MKKWLIASLLVVTASSYAVPRQQSDLRSAAYAAGCLALAEEMQLPRGIKDKYRQKQALLDPASVEAMRDVAQKKSEQLGLQAAYHQHCDYHYDR